MEVLKRKILLENSVDKSYESKDWGGLTASTFYIKIILTQKMDDMGIFSDMEYITKDITNTVPDYTILKNKLNSLGYVFPFMNGNVSPVFTNSTIPINYKDILRLPINDVSNYYVFGNSVITGATDSRIEDVRSYDGQSPFKVGFDISKETYDNYNNDNINGVDRVISVQEPKKYVFDANNDTFLGSTNQTSGLLFYDYTGDSRTIVVEGVITTIPLTTYQYVGEGKNETNTSLSALNKQEYLFGIVSPPEIINDVFIERGITSVNDMHLKLSEINSISDLDKYGNGLYRNGSNGNGSNGNGSNGNNNCK